MITAPSTPPDPFGSIVIVELGLVIELPDNEMPPANKVPPVIAPVALINPLVKTLPPVTLPLALTTPVTYAPVGANTTTLPTPLTPTVMLEAAAAMLMLELPF